MNYLFEFIDQIMNNKDSLDDLNIAMFDNFSFLIQ